MTTSPQSRRVSGWTIAICAAAALLVYWIVDVRRSPAITKARAVADRYACLKADDPGVGYKHKSMVFSERTYHSMGGENYIQALWWLPLTQLAISVQFSRNQISQMYAATARVWGSEEIVGFDALSRLLYGRGFCDLDRTRRSAVDYIAYPRDLPADGDIRAEIDHGMSVLKERNDRIRAQRRAQREARRRRSW